MLSVSKTRAAILTQLKTPLAIDEIGLPSSLEFGQVLAKVHYSGICGTQLGEIDGAKGSDPWLPHLLGHEATAEVIEVGNGVSRVKPSDTVVLHWMKAGGLEGPTPKYSWNGKTVNAGWVTTFQEYTIVSENRCTPIPATTDLESACLYGCAVTTGFGVINNNAHLRIGESLLVFGAGGLGLSIIQGAHLAGAHPIIAVDRFDNRLELARSIGATHAFNSSRDDIEKDIASLAPRGLSVVVDNTGIPSIIASCYRMCGPQGRVILVGVPKKGDETPLYTLPLHFGKVITGSHGGSTKPDIDIPNYLALESAGRFSLKKLVTERTSLDKINDAIQAMRSGASAGRCIIKMH